MLTAEEAYLKKVYDGTEQPTRLSIEYATTEDSGDYSHKDGRTTDVTKIRLSIDGRVKLDSTPITPWAHVLDFTYTSYVAPSNNNNNNGG